MTWRNFVLQCLKTCSACCHRIRDKIQARSNNEVAFAIATAWSLLPAVGVCFPGYAAASKSINTGVNHAEKDGLLEFI